MTEFCNDDTEQCYERGQCADKVVIIPVQETLIYPGYSEDNVPTHDIALLVLTHPVTFSSYIQPICLPTPSDEDDDGEEESELMVTGWGNTQPLSFSRKDFVSATVLQYLDVRSLSNEECSVQWDR